MRAAAHVLGVLAMTATALAACDRSGQVQAGFWFEPVAFSSSTIGGGLTAADLETIEAVAREELSQAFAGLRIAISDRRDARYRVRVVQRLRDLRRRRADFGGPAGESRAIAGFGGSGAVSFDVLASSAVGYAPPGTTRSAIVVAIGRGVGRAAVHEFVHQLLPTTAIDATRNARSYEYGYAGRTEQYYGPMQWDFSHALLERRHGSGGE